MLHGPYVLAFSHSNSHSTSSLAELFPVVQFNGQDCQVSAWVLARLLNLDLSGGGGVSDYGTYPEKNVSVVFNMWTL